MHKICASLRQRFQFVRRWSARSGRRPRHQSHQRSSSGSPPVRASTDFRASMMRDISPPEAILASGRSGSPGLGESRNSTRSAPLLATGCGSMDDFKLGRRHAQIGQFAGDAATKTLGWLCAGPWSAGPAAAVKACLRLWRWPRSVLPRALRSFPARPACRPVLLHTR